MLGSSRFWTLTVCLLAAACGEARETARSLDAGTAAVTADATAALRDGYVAARPLGDAALLADAALPKSLAPPLTWSTCPFDSIGLGFRLLLDAAELGSGTELVKASVNLVLARGGPLPWALVELDPPGSVTKPQHRYWPLPAGLRGIGVTTGTRELEYGAVLVCSETSADCSLLQLTTQNGLRPIKGSALPTGFVPRDLSNDGRDPCALGHALLCFRDGVWKTAIGDLGNDDELVGLSVEEGLSGLAISKSGRVWRVTNDRSTGAVTFVEQPKVPATLSQVSVSGQHGYLVGPDSLWCFGQQGSERCDQHGTYLAALTDYEGENQALVTERGEVLTRNFGDWCQQAGLSIGAPVLAATHRTCGVTSNFRVLTAQQLVGEDSCVLVP